MKRARGDTDLRSLLPHLCYEIKMLLATDLLLLREQTMPRDPQAFDEWATHNALCEAHAIHARNLYAFFYQGPTKADDACASDYAPDWSRRGTKADRVLRTLSKKMGQETAHLTYKRPFKDTDREWMFTDVTRALVATINQWLLTAPGYVSPMLSEYLADYARQIEIHGSHGG